MNSRRVVEDETWRRESWGRRCIKQLEEWREDPMVRVRTRTAIRGSIAVFISTIFVYSEGAFRNFPLIAIVLCSHFTISLMSHSIVGVVGTAIQSVTGGLVGCFFGYLAHLAAPHLAVKLVYLFIFCLVVGFWDPYLKQGIMVKWCLVDFFVVLFVGETAFAPHSMLYGTVMLYVVSHWFSFVIAIVLTLLLWPSLSSLEFTHEFKLSLRLCSEVFKLISYRIDREILRQSNSSTNGKPELSASVELESVLHVHGLPDSDIKELEQVLSLRLIRLRRLMNESKAEWWNKKIANNEKLLEHINTLYHQLTNMHDAINAGQFSGVVNHSFLEPMLPFMETYQKSIISHFDALLSDAPNMPPSPVGGRTKHAKHEVVARVLAAVDLDESARVLDAEYSNRVRDYETRDHGVANPSREVARLVYIIFGSVDFAHTLHELEVLLETIGQDKRSDYRAIWTDVVLHFNLFPNPSPVKYVKDIVNHIKTLYNDTRTSTWASARHSQFWRFPIRLAAGLTALTLILYAIPKSATSDFPFWTPYWATLTYVVAVLPTLGATIRKCVHRVSGTVAGAFLGHVFLLALLAVPLPARPFIHLVLQLIYFFVIMFLQQLPSFGYSATVSGLTYLTVFIGQYKVGHGDVRFACMRCFFIVIGVLWTFVVGNLFFPSKSSVTYTRTLVDTISKIASIFNIIIAKTVTPNSVGTPEQEEEITKAIAGVHSNYLSMRNNLKEAKSELIFQWSGYTKFKNALNQALKAYYTLANMNTILHNGFSPVIAELVELMKEHLRRLPPPILESAERINDAAKKKKHIPNLEATPVSAATVLRTIEKEYFLFRKRHIEQKTLASLHPAIRQFTTFLYLIREFVMEWRIMVETVNTYMGLAIEIYPLESLESAELELQDRAELSKPSELLITNPVTPSETRALTSAENPEKDT